VQEIALFIFSTITGTASEICWSRTDLDLRRRIQFVRFLLWST